MQEVAQGQPNGLTAVHNGTDDVGCQEGIADGLAHAGLWDGVFDGNLTRPSRPSQSGSPAPTGQDHAFSI